MAEDHAISPATDHLCPWCSSALPDPAPARCPACSASLTPMAGDDVPGVTTVDPMLVRRTASQPVSKRRFLGFLHDGDGEPAGPEVEPSSLEALAPPSDAVRIEMQRLRAEIEAAAAADDGRTVPQESGPAETGDVGEHPAS